MQSKRLEAKLGANLIPGLRCYKSVVKSQSGSSSLGMLGSLQGQLLGSCGSLSRLLGTHGSLGGLVGGLGHILAPICFLCVQSFALGSCGAVRSDLQSSTYFKFRL